MKSLVKHTSPVSDSKEFTLFHCTCGTILKEGRDAHLGSTWILANGTLVTDRACNISMIDPDVDRSDNGMGDWQFTDKVVATA